MPAAAFAAGIQEGTAMARYPLEASYTQEGVKKHSMFTRSVLAAAVACVGLSACGGSSSTSSSSGAGSSSSAASTPTAAISIPGGSGFCGQAASAIGQLSALSKGFAGISPGATPSLTAFQQLIGAATQAIDTLDSSAPSEIASAFHTLRAAYDQGNAQVQSATSLQQLSTAFSSFDTQPVKDADAAITAYGKNTCGFTPSP